LLQNKTNVRTFVIISLLNTIVNYLIITIIIIIRLILTLIKVLLSFYMTFGVKQNLIKSNGPSNKDQITYELVVNPVYV